MPATHGCTSHAKRRPPVTRHRGAGTHLHEVRGAAELQAREVGSGSQSCRRGRGGGTRESRLLGTRDFRGATDKPQFAAAAAQPCGSTKHVGRTRQGRTVRDAKWVSCSCSQNGEQSARRAESILLTHPILSLSPFSETTKRRGLSVRWQCPQDAAPDGPESPRGRGATHARSGSPGCEVRSLSHHG